MLSLQPVLHQNTQHRTVEIQCMPISKICCKPMVYVSAVDQNKIPLIVGIVVGVGGGIIAIVLTIVIFLFYKRKKRGE